jgi:hypothetical protein
VSHGGISVTSDVDLSAVPDPRIPIPDCIAVTLCGAECHNLIHDDIAVISTKG